MNQQSQDTRAPNARLTEQRRVKRSQSEAFVYTADFSNIAEWDPGTAASRKVGDEPVGVGTQFELEVKFGGGTVPMIYEITAYEPDSRVVLVGTGDKLKAVDEILFSTEGDMTVVDYTADLTFYNFYKYLGPVLGPALKKVGREALDGLAAALEG